MSDIVYSLCCRCLSVNTTVSALIYKITDLLTFDLKVTLLLLIAVIVFNLFFTLHTFYCNAFQSGFVYRGH